MRQTYNGRPSLLLAPALALTATLALLAITEQTGVVTLWGGLATLVAAVPLVVPQEYLRPAVWTCAALVTVLVVMGSASIGFFYAPVVVALPLSLCFAPAPHDEPWPYDDAPCEDQVSSP